MDFNLIDRWDNRRDLENLFGLENVEVRQSCHTQLVHRFDTKLCMTYMNVMRIPMECALPEATRFSIACHVSG